MINTIDEFNQRWQNRSVPHCEYLFTQMRIATSKVYYSCYCICNVSEFPFFLEKNLDFSIKNYLNELDILLKKSQKGESLCCNCKYATNQPIKKLEKNNINQITFDYFKNCNANCIYCFAQKGKTERKTEEVLNFIKQLEKNNILDKECSFRWGGGEPTILEDFDKLYNFIAEKKYQQCICTSGIIYSKTVEHALKNGNQVIISPDSGTKETFKKVKRIDKYEAVWKNIKKYASFNGDLHVKYVVFCLNSNISEIEKFIEKCIENGVKTIIIDCESYSSSDKFSYPAKITEKEIRAAKKLKELCIKNNLNYSIGLYWNKEHVDKINLEE